MAKDKSEKKDKKKKETKEVTETVKESIQVNEDVEMGDAELVKVRLPSTRRCLSSELFRRWRPRSKKRRRRLLFP